MLKLYRRGERLEYWEAWDTGESALMVHWGEVGTPGEAVELPLGKDEDPARRIEAEAGAHRARGFAEVAEDDLATVVVQYEREPERRARRKVAQRMDAVERRVNEALGWTGLGHCEDVDFSVEFSSGAGVGQLTVIARAVDGPLALTVLRDELAEHGMLAGAVIAIEEDDQYVVRWPEAQAGRTII